MMHSLKIICMSMPALKLHATSLFCLLRQMCRLLLLPHQILLNLRGSSSARSMGTFVSSLNSSLNSKCMCNRCVRLVSFHLCLSPIFAIVLDATSFPGSCYTYDVFTRPWDTLRAISIPFRRISTQGKFSEVNQDTQYILKGSSG